MLRIRRLLESGVWLLVPGPKEEERSTGSAVVSLLLAAFFALQGVLFDYYGFVPDFFEPSYGAPVDRPAVLLAAAILLLFSVLYALPPHQCLARLCARVALTLAVLALIVWFPLARMGSYGTLVAALLVLIFFCINHFVNRRRALGFLDPPTD